MHTPRWKDVVPWATRAPDWTVETTWNRVEAITSWAKRPDTLKVLSIGKVYADGGAPVLVPEDQYGEFVYDPTLATEYSLWFRNPNSNSAVVVEVGHVHYYFDPKKGRSKGHGDPQKNGCKRQSCLKTGRDYTMGRARDKTCWNYAPRRTLHAAHSGRNVKSSSACLKGGWCVYRNQCMGGSYLRRLFSYGTYLSRCEYEMAHEKNAIIIAPAIEFFDSYRMYNSINTFVWIPPDTPESIEALLWELMTKLPALMKGKSLEVKKRLLTQLFGEAYISLEHTAFGYWTVSSHLWSGIFSLESDNFLPFQEGEWVKKYFQTITSKWVVPLVDCSYVLTLCLGGDRIGPKEILLIEGFYFIENGQIIRFQELPPGCSLQMAITIFQTQRNEAIALWNKKK